MVMIGEKIKLHRIAVSSRQIIYMNCSALSAVKEIYEKENKKSRISILCLEKQFRYIFFIYLCLTDNIGIDDLI
jgi:hypothetical protein